MTGEISTICARSDLFLVIGPNPSAPTRRAVDTTIRAGGRLDDILGALTSEGLALAPAFAAAEPAGDDGADVRILVRGELEFELERLNGDRLTVTSGRSTTWNDDVVSGVRRIAVAVPGGAEVVWVHPASPPEPPSASPTARSDLSTAGNEPSGDSEETRRLSRDDMHLPVAGDADPSHSDEPPSHEQAAEEAPVPPADDHSGRNGTGDPADRPTPVETVAQVPTPDVSGDADDNGAAGRWEEVDPEDDPYLSNLLDHTIFHDVESAAVRSADDPDSDSDAGDTASGSNGTPPAAAPIHEGSPTLQEPPDPLMASPSDPPPAHGRSPSAPSARPGVIAAVPGRSTSVPGARDLPPPGSMPAPQAHLLTSVVTDEPMISDGLGDNDGHTVALRDAVAASTGGGSQSTDVAGTPAMRCRRGHLNPPTTVRCRSCGLELTDRDITRAVMPVVARLRFETGLVVDVDRMQVIGRQPTATDFEGGQIPNLVALPSPEGDLSRIHLAIRLEDWNILVEDLGSTNGTEVRLPHQEPERLREFSPKLVVPGTTVTLGGTATFHIDLPE